MSAKPEATVKYSSYHRPESQKIQVMKFDSVNPELDAARIRVGLPRQKFFLNNDNSYLNTYSFNGLNPGLKANKSQTQDYNNLRKYTSSFEATTDKTKNVYANEQSYELNGNAVEVAKTSLYNPPTIVDNRTMSENVPNVESYKAADGTIYKIFNTPDGVTREANYPTKNVIHVPGKYHELYRQWASSDEIPQNIRHRFGTYDTERLLADKIKVHDTLSKIHNTGIIKKKVKEEENELNVNKNERDVVINEYYDLGNHLRHAIGHGYPTVYKTGHRESIHNEDVNKKHMENWNKNVITPHRRKTDWLSQWLELSIIDDRVLKDFKVFKDEQAKKLPVIPREPIERPKPKKNLENEKKKESKKQVSDEVKIEEPVADVKPNEGFQEDKQFWDYYDKNT